MNQQKKSKSPQESPFYQSKRPQWRDFRRFERPRKEPRILSKKPGTPIGLIIKKLWFPMLLLPLTIFIAITYTQRSWNIFRIPIFEPKPEPEAYSPPDEGPTQAPTDNLANWKTYRNEFLLFKYPPEWVVGKTNIYGSSNETEFTYNFGKPFYLVIRTNYNQTRGKPHSTIDEYLPSLSDISKNITLNKQPAKYISREGGEHFIASEQVVVFSIDKSLIIELTYQPDFYIPENKETFNQILSTFIFIN